MKVNQRWQKRDAWVQRNWTISRGAPHHSGWFFKLSSLEAEWQRRQTTRSGRAASNRVSAATPTAGVANPRATPTVGVACPHATPSAGAAHHGGSPANHPQQQDAGVPNTRKGLNKMGSDNCCFYWLCWDFVFSCCVLPHSSLWNTGGM